MLHGREEEDKDDTVITGGYIIQNGVQSDSKSPNAFITKHGEWAVDTPNFDPDDGGYVNDKQRNYIVNYVNDLETIMFGKELSGGKGTVTYSKVGVTLRKATGYKE